MKRLTISLIAVLASALFLPTSHICAEEIMLDPVQQRVLGSTADYKSHQVIDFDGDGYDDIAVLFLHRLYIYSPTKDSLLWQLSLDQASGFVLYEDDSATAMQTVVSGCGNMLYHYSFPDTIPSDSTELVTGWPNASSGCHQTQLAVRDLGSNGSRELTVTRYRGTSYLCRMTGWYENWYDNFAFSLSDMSQQEFFEDYSYGSYLSDSVALEADLDGDGLPETVAFGRSLRGGCDYNDSGEMLGGYNYTTWEVFVYNQIGQCIGQQVDRSPMAATAGDYSPQLTGDECIVRVSGTQHSGTLLPNSGSDNLFSFKLDNAQFVTLWSREAGEYGLEFLQHPAFPNMFGLEHESGLAWHIFDGSDGSLVHALYGLQPHKITLGGNFTPAADTGLQVVQIAGDTITLYGSAVPTDVDDNTDPILPSGFVLQPNYPNPFNPTTEIRFELPRATEITLEVFSITGQRVAVLIDRALPAGEHTATWNAENYASGVYLYRLTAGENTLARKMMLLK